MKHSRTFIFVMSVAAILGGCSVGPDYHRPDAPTPQGFKELAGWTPSQPNELADRGAWWSVYNDPVLDDLLKQIDVSNQNLKASEAAYRQARAVIDEARAGYFPSLSLTASGQRSKSGGGELVTTGVGVDTGSSSGHARNSYNLSLGASWDIDVWGKIRRTVEGDVASAQASAADLAGARLSAQATLATDYFELRIDDELKRLLDDATVAYTRSLDITRNQYAVGVAAKADVLTAQTQLDSTQAQAINVGVQRAQLEHAIAVLVGKPPAEFSIAPAALGNEVPVMPTGVPSILLERRPDIAAAERQMAAANAQIGIAVAGYYPDLTLSGVFGYASPTLGNLLRASNNLWSYGGTLAETLFNGGLTGAQISAAHASYDQSVATYRQTVLAGFQQVEDELAALRILEQQAGVEDRTVADAREAERLTLNQYKAGTVPYSSVVTAQVAALSNEQTALTVRENRLLASVTLIEALGGGWDSTHLADRN